MDFTLLRMCHSGIFLLAGDTVPCKKRFFLNNRMRGAQWKRIRVTKFRTAKKYFKLLASIARATAARAAHAAGAAFQSFQPMALRGLFALRLFEIHDA